MPQAHNSTPGRIGTALRIGNSTVGSRRAHRKCLGGGPPVLEVRVGVAQRLRDDEPPDAAHPHARQAHLHARDQLRFAVLNPQKVFIISLEGATLGLHADQGLAYISPELFRLDAEN